MLATRIVSMLDRGSHAPEARLFRGAHHAALATAVVASALLTLPAIADGFSRLITTILALTLGFFIAEWALRLLVAPFSASGLDRLAARVVYAASPMGVIDAVGALAVPVALLVGVPPRTAWLLVLLWLAKLARYLPGFPVLTRVLINERQSLLGVLVVFITILLLASAGEYMLEHEIQPANFGSLPSAMWWAIVTLTTTGYGDVVPRTALGRMLGGAVMISGIAVFALWAGILASGFVAEIRRRDFLAAWKLVAQVPFFRDVGAATIAEVARVLRQREVTAGTTLMRRGQAGDCMYFLVSGEIEVELEPKPIRMGPGGFIGEIALITGGPRSATVVATRRSELLVLDVVDFHELAVRHPELTLAIEREGARRLTTLQPGRKPSAEG